MFSPNAPQINYRMRVTLNDGRQMTGQMLAFDKVFRLNALPNAPSNPLPAYEPRPRRH